jgi:hypothetical protein
MAGSYQIHRYALHKPLLHVCANQARLPELLKKPKQDGTSRFYEVKAANKTHEIWQRDSLSIEIGNIA